MQKIKIKASHKGRFTEYCGGKVTEACISKGKNSPSASVRKQATFAGNSRLWGNKKKKGGILTYKVGGKMCSCRKRKGGILYKGGGSCM